MRTLSVDSLAVSGLYIEKLLQIADEEGVDISQILSELNVVRDNLCSSTRRFSYRELYHVVDTLEVSHKISGLGFMLGRREGPITEGFLGFACISAADLRAAIDTFIRFAGCFSGSINDLEMSFEIERNEVRLSFQEAYPLGKYLRFSMEELLAHWLMLFEQLQGGGLRLLAVRLTYDRPNYSKMYSDVLKCPVHFNQQENQMCFPAAYLGVPFVTSNATIHRLCLSHCETIYGRMAKSGEFAQEIKSIIMSMATDPPKLGILAEHFNLTPRSMRRRLKAENTSFQEILFETRMELAADYLTNTSAAISEIAYQLGYREVASFYRNFRRWSGMTPLQFRESNRRSDTSDY